jgi:hypothetical protein
VKLMEIFGSSKHYEMREKQYAEYLEQVRRKNPTKYRKLLIAQRLHKKPGTPRTPE